MDRFVCRIPDMNSSLLPVVEPEIPERNISRFGLEDCDNLTAEYHVEFARNTVI